MRKKTISVVILLLGITMVLSCYTRHKEKYRVSVYDGGIVKTYYMDTLKTENCCIVLNDRGHDVAFCGTYIIEKR